MLRDAHLMHLVLAGVAAPSHVYPRLALISELVSRELTGIYSARLARNWRVLYEIDDTKHVVIVLDIRHRSAAYRLRQ